MTNAMFDDVTDTASWVAAYRAKESARPDALFRDSLAERVTDERGRRIADEIVGTENFEWAIVLRTLILDELIGAAVGSGVDAVLNLGAGMDTRPYRLSLPSALRWFEVDHAKVIERKEERLRGESPVCVLRRVPMDLANLAERRTLFAEVNDSSKRVLVVAEGMIGYLRNEDVGVFATDLAGCGHFSEWIVDYSSPMLRKAMRRRRKVQEHFRMTPPRFDPQDWDGFFSQHGWTVRSMRFLGEEGDRRGRPVPLPWWMRILTRLSASQRTEVRKMLGFAMMERTKT
jgi:methyltransferase (TIGR00027 family)